MMTPRLFSLAVISAPETAGTAIHFMVLMSLWGTTAPIQFIVL